MSKLARLLDSPALARVVPHLPAETLHQLIRYQGLEACGDLVVLATPAQLTSVLDLDLWHPTRPGRDDQFDVDRFAEWIEMLVDTGDAVAARTIAALDTNVVVEGLSRYVRVFDPGIFEPTTQSDDEQGDYRDAMREGDSPEGYRLTCEVGGYIVRARRGDAWDAMVAMLHALEHREADCFDVVMQGCRRLSNSTPEVDGLHDLLMAPEQHLHDITLEREERRSRQGYATAADARAFLQMARTPNGRRNPIAAAYFRAAEEEPAAVPAPTDEDVTSSLDAITEALVEAGVTLVSPRALLQASTREPESITLKYFRQLVAHADDTSSYLARSHELAFLANTLLAGCSVQSRPFTTQEASEAAASICNLGLEQTPNILDLVTAFEAG